VSVVDLKFKIILDKLTTMYKKRFEWSLCVAQLKKKFYAFERESYFLLHLSLHFSTLKRESLKILSVAQS
jgi:hypothetical protein